MKAFVNILLAYLSVAMTVSFSDSKFITNPVIPGEDLPDPGAIFYNGLYYVTGTTGTPTEKFSIHSSVDLQNWNFEGYAFVKNALPSWSNANSDFWAPEIHIINGQFRLVFTSRETDSGILCIGIARADSITGPYTDIGYPVIRDTTVGSIDASVLTLSDTENYLIWKDDGNGNNPQIPTWIKAQRLDDDGTSV